MDLPNINALLVTSKILTSTWGAHFFFLLEQNGIIRFGEFFTFDGWKEEGLPCPAKVFGLHAMQITVTIFLDL